MRVRGGWFTLVACVVGLAACSGDGPSEARVSSLLGRIASTAMTAGAVEVGAPGASQALGDGWHVGEGSAAGWRAWMKGSEASVWMVVDRPIDGILWVRASPPAFLPDQTLEVLIDGTSLGTQPLQKGMRWVAYPVRATQLEAGYREVVLRAGRVGTPLDHGAALDARPLSVAVEWVLLSSRGEQPAKRVTELRAGTTQRRLESGAVRLLPGDFASLAFPRKTALGFDFEHSGGALLTEVVERGSWDSLWRDRTTAPGTRRTTVDVEPYLQRELVLNLAVPGDSAPVELSLAEVRSVPRPWNIVFLVVDTLRADALLDEDGVYDTPAIDRLAADGIAFPRTYAHAPMTLPSHTALFSSQLPHVSGVVNNWQTVDSAIPLFSEWLQRSGYDRRAVLSLGTLWNSQPGTSVDRGFEIYQKSPDDMAFAPFTSDRLQRTVDELDPTKPFFLFAHFSDPHEPYNTRGGPETRAQLSLNAKPLAEVRTSEMTVWKKQVMLDPGENTIEVDADHDFFVKHFYVRAGETKLTPAIEEGALRKKGRRLRAVIVNEQPEAVAARLNIWLHDAPDAEERKRRYREEVAYVDRAIGLFLDHLRGHGLYEDALVVFTSDHGEALGERGSWGHVETLKEEMIHVPLVIKPPAGHPATARLRTQAGGLVRHVDLVPTVLDLLELRPLPGQMGISLLDDAPRIVLAETHQPEARRDKICIRDERFKMIFVAPDEEREEAEQLEMYDLESDPGELHNVFGERNSERPDWEQQLRDMHALYESTAGIRDASPEALERLEALGYAQHD